MLDFDELRTSDSFLYAFNMLSNLVIINWNWNHIVQNTYLQKLYQTHSYSNQTQPNLWKVSPIWCPEVRYSTFWQKYLHGLPIPQKGRSSIINSREIQATWNPRYFISTPSFEVHASISWQFNQLPDPSRVGNFSHLWAKLIIIN